MSDDSFDDVIGYDSPPRTLESPYHEPNFNEVSFIDDADRVSGERDETFPTSAVEASIKASVPTSIDSYYKIHTVTIVSGIDKRIHLARLCDASPHIFGVHSKGCAASPPEKASKGGFKNGCSFLSPQRCAHDGKPRSFAGRVHANGTIQITSIPFLEDVDSCLSQVVDLIEEAHMKSSPSAPVILNFDPALPLVRIQTELTIRLGLQLPFEVDYGRFQQLFYTNAMFERPSPSQVTIKETREPLPSGSGPFFRIERNNFSSAPFQSSFCVFRSGKIQARCRKISADVTDMIDACKDVDSILKEHRLTIEAPASASGARQQRGKGASPPRSLIQTSSAICYPKALHVVYVKLPLEMTSSFSKYEQAFTDCAENCLLRFIQLALLDSGGDGRMINTARARELGATVEICEYFSRYPTAFSQTEYEEDQYMFPARCQWTELTCSRPAPCAYVRTGGFEMQAGATNFLAVLQSMFPRLKLPQASMMRNCGEQQLIQGFDAATSFFSLPNVSFDP